ncbi:MAG: shikimate kinase AroK [Betaproteobacteria bacterium]|nr:shikimate kinase AroK [Betaproteobacteria bacterium]MDE2624054.1 shikimate kinase AroK [Betaproteobacteria bacterium]
MNAERNFFLVGLMGAGKTTVGRALARRMNLTFVDSDHEIEARTGVRIATIFELEGEAGFRAREEDVIAQLVTRKGIVLATGGGAVLSAKTRQRLRQQGTVIYLRACTEDLWQRTRHDRNRPLLQTEDPKARLRQLYEERDPLYREVAHIILDTAHQSVQKLVTQLEAEIERQSTNENTER